MLNSDTEKIDVHNMGKKYERRLKTLKEDKTINAENKKLIFDFVHGCAIGKISRKPCQPSRLMKYIYIMSRLNDIFGNKPFRSITEREVENLIVSFNNRAIKRQLVRLKKNVKGKEVIKVKTDKPLADDTVSDFKIMIKRLFKFIYGEGDKYQSIAGWIKCEGKIKEIPSLSRAEIERLANSTNAKNKALIMVLYDSGARIEEFLNLRIGDLMKKENNNGCYYQIRIKHSKTKPRTISIPMCTEVLNTWLSIHPGKDNPQSQLFPSTYDGIRVFLRQLSRKILNKNVNPHLLRHSSATYYCHKLNHYQLCYRYGWSMTSNQPQRYIDREGINEEETATAVQGDDVKKLRQELEILKETNTMLRDEQEKQNRALQVLDKAQEKEICLTPKELRKVIKEMLTNGDLPLKKF